MNTKILTATAFAALAAFTLTSCDGFFRDKNETTKKPALNNNFLIGKWDLDSIDKTIFNLDGSWDSLLFSKPAFYNTLHEKFQFSPDSIYTVYSEAGNKLGNNKYYFDSAAQKLFIREYDTTYSLFLPVFINDSTIRIDFWNAGIHYYFVRQQ